MSTREFWNRDGNLSEDAMKTHHVRHVSLGGKHDTKHVSDRMFIKKSRV